MTTLSECNNSTTIIAQKTDQIKQLILFASPTRIKLLKAVCSGGATPIAVREMQRMGLVQQQQQHYTTENNNHTVGVVDDEKKTQAVKKNNNNNSPSLTGYGLPRLTPAGVGMMLAHQLQVSFFDICVLAKIYHCIVQMSENPHGTLQQQWRQQWGKGVEWEEDTTKKRKNKVYLPSKTLGCFFEDWPTIYDNRIGHAVAKLRAKKMLPKSPYSMLSCDIAQWQHAHDKLVMLSEWIDERGEMVRDIILSARRDEKLEREGRETVVGKRERSPTTSTTLDSSMSAITSSEDNMGGKYDTNHTIDDFSTVQPTLAPPPPSPEHHNNNNFQPGCLHCYHH